MSDKKVYFFIENNKYNEIPDEELIELTRKGDMKAQNYLLEKYKSLVGMKANKFFLVGAEDDDIIQEGMIGLFKAIQSSSFRMDWLDLLAVQGTLKSLLQHHSSKASILRRSAFFIVQLSHAYMTTGKTIALTR